jgi:hypothetical protein
MINKQLSHRKLLFTGIIVITLGINLTTQLKDSFRSIGVALIAIGGFFIIVGMRMKREEEENINNRQK